MIIAFEDNGQPYRAWKVNFEGLVVECYPAHSFFWIGKYVFMPETLQIGDCLQYADSEIATNTNLKYLRHKIISVKIA